MLCECIYSVYVVWLSANCVRVFTFHSLGKFKANQSAWTLYSLCYMSVHLCGSSSIHAFPLCVWLTQKRFQAMYSYMAADADEVSLQEGDLILDVEPIDDGWVFGCNQRTGQRGLLPANYVRPVWNKHTCPTDVRRFTSITSCPVNLRSPPTIRLLLI